MRLLDRLLSSPFDTGLYFEKAELVEPLENSQLVLVDNVSDYLLTCKAGEPVVPTDFPCVMLPFDYTFIETKLPRSVWKGEVEEVGILFSMGKPKITSKTEVPDEIQNWLLRPEVAYHLNAVVFFNYRQHKEPVVMSELVIPIDKDGRVTTGDGRFKVFVTCPYPMSAEYSEQELLDKHTEAASVVLLPALLALSFMHCRNVTVIKESPPEPLSRKHERRTGRALISYRLLKIDHMKRILERVGHASTEGLKKALHICRGHFVTYGADGKGFLFGKIAGRFFIPMHARGNPERGVVDKDYDVK